MTETTLPAPLTPANCRLRGCLTMPLDVARFRRSALFSTPCDAAFVAGVQLMCIAWQQTPAASLPDDDKALAYFAGLGRRVRRWQRLRDAALSDWRLCSDGRLYHPDVATAALERWLELRLVDARRRTAAARHAERSTLDDITADIAAALERCDPWSRAPVLRRARRWLARHEPREALSAGELRRMQIGREAQRMRGGAS